MATTMSSEPAPTLAATAIEDGERRLHPLSWLFLALAQLRQFALPLIALLLFGRGGGSGWGWEWFGAVGALGVAAVGVLQYFTYRFRIAAGELTIRSGLLSRTVRHIPLARIQNVALRRNLLHRLLGVAEVRLESAAGIGKAEAEMRVLSLADAAALEALVRASRGEAVADPEAATAPLLAVPTAELVRLGLASDRGMVVVAAAFGVFAQGWADGYGRELQRAGSAAYDYARALSPGPLDWLFGALLLLLTAVLLLRLLSVLLVLLRLHGFELREDGERLSVEGGLLTRLRGHAARSKIQRWLLSDNLWLRGMGRRRLKIETAAAPGAGQEAHALSDLVPIGRDAVIDALLQRWLPVLAWPGLTWQPLHPDAWRRFLLLPALLCLAASLPLLWRFGASGAAILLLLPLLALRARQLGRWSAWMVDERFVAWRSGWLDRHWQIVPIDRIQLLRVEQSPFDRRRGMASLLLDTAGAHSSRPALRLRHLPEATVHALAERLGRAIAIPTASMFPPDPPRAG
jgi:putative membrane protein